MFGIIEIFWAPLLGTGLLMKRNTEDMYSVHDLKKGLSQENVMVSTIT